MSPIDLKRHSPMDPAYRQDPYPYFAALRREAPVFQHPNGVFFISSLAGVLEVLGQPEVFSSRWGNTAGPPPVSGADTELAEIMADAYPAVSTLFTEDPPLQTRYRMTVGVALSPRRIQALEPRIREIAGDLIEVWPERGRVDFVETLAVPLPVRVIGHALSIPPERDADVKRWSDDSVGAIGPEVSRERGLEAARSIVEMQQFLASLVDERRREPGGDVVSALAAADFEEPGGSVRKLEMPELLSIIQQLMVAGNEATSKGISEIMKLLLENPGEWKRIQEDPATIPAMVEEGLRLASPNQGLFRIATRDAEVDGVAIPEGSMLWVIFGSANRDEKSFPDPDRFDPTRDNLHESVAFGRGAHACVGAPLGRLELRVLFEELVRRVESIRFAPGSMPEYEPSFILRGLKQLEIEVVRRKR